MILPYISKTIWLKCVIFSDNETVWLNFDLKFHGPVLSPYILKTVWYMNILIWDYESVWPDVWPQNKMKVTVTFISWSIDFALYLEDCLMYEHQPQSKGRSLWPVFHGPVILPYISKTIWWMCVIFSDNETLFLKRWPQNKYRSTWLTFHGLVILLNIFTIIWWMNIIVGLMDQCDTKIDLIKYM